MTNRLLYIIILLFISTVTFGQKQTAKSIIEDVRKHYNSNYGFESDFSFEIDYPETDAVVTNGRLYLKGDKFRFVTKSEEYISDNVSMWVWTKANGINEVQVSYIEDDEDFITLSDVFNVYLKGFAYKLINTYQNKGETIGLIELVPVTRDDKNPYFKVKTVVNLDKDQLKQLQVFYKDGTVYTFSIENEKPAVLVNAHFEFDVKQHAEVEIIDLR